jgi:1,4-alpha-glucan branching enzyme
MMDRETLPDGRVRVTFRIPHHNGAANAVVTGDFNDWSHEATPMVRTATGFEVELALGPGRAYRFRYLLDGARWENDWAADRYDTNDFGGNDSVIDLTGDAPA